MAYIKFKELTQYFNFSGEIDVKTLPEYVLQYINSEDKVLAAYKTYRDFGVFTDKKIILFDQQGVLGKTFEISIIPYSSVCSHSIKFEENSTDILIYLDSGYPMKLRFVKTYAEEKKRLRELFTEISKNMVKVNT